MQGFHQGSHWRNKIQGCFFGNDCLLPEKKVKSILLDIIQWLTASLILSLDGTIWIPEQHTGSL